MSNGNLRGFVGVGENEHLLIAVFLPVYFSQFFYFFNPFDCFEPNVQFPRLPYKPDFCT